MRTTGITAFLGALLCLHCGDGSSGGSAATDAGSDSAAGTSSGGTGGVASGGAPSGGTGGGTATGGTFTGGSGGVAGNAGVAGAPAGGSGGTATGGAAGAGGSGGCAPAQQCSGVCTNLDTDVSNCGACGNVCPAGDPKAGNGFVVCKQGTCAVSCLSNKYADCNGQTIDGCETNIFTSTSHCGSCGKKCDMPCVNGMCTLKQIAAGLDAPTHIAVDATDVYVAEQNQISKVPYAGGTPTVVAATGTVGDMELSATHLYWTDSKNGQVRRIPLAGGTPQTLSTGVALKVRNLAIDASDVFFTTGFDGELKKVPASGGATTVLSSGWPYTADVLSTGATLVFAVTNSSGGLYSLPASGGTATQLAPSSQPDRVVTDGSQVYWWSGQNVLAVPLTGGATQTLTSGQVNIRNIATDGTDVYWVSEQKTTVPSAPGMLRRVPVAGGTPTVLWASVFNPKGLAVTSTHVFYTEVTQGKIWRASKSSLDAAELQPAVAGIRALVGAGLVGEARAARHASQRQAAEQRGKACDKRCSDAHGMPPFGTVRVSTRKRSSSGSNRG